MKKILILACWLLPALVNAQKNQGISFQNFDNWKQLLVRAKAEHKNIFIDAYATWCGPCKKMDEDIYTDPKIGDLVNANFIALKVQFDQQKNDDEQVKKWYEDAKYLLNKFHIEAFPTFIFLTPEGELIYKEVGYQDIEHFTNLLNRANNPDLSYVSQVAKFRLGKMLDSELLELSLTARLFKDSIAIAIAKAYKNNVLEKNDPSKTLNPKVADFIVEFQQLFRVNDRSVNFLFHNQEKGDQLLGQKGFSKRFTDYLITKNDIDPMVRPLGVNSVKEPNWAELERNLKRKYGTVLTNRLLVTEKYDWYTNKKDWPNAVKYTMQYLEIIGIDTATMAASSINGIIFNIIFMHGDDPVDLNKVIEYMKIIVKSNPTHHPWIDTYANLLYKVGRKKEAIIQEQQALDIVTKLNDSDNVTYYKQIIEKMESNKPTWQ